MSTSVIHIQGCSKSPPPPQIPARTRSNTITGLQMKASPTAMGAAPNDRDAHIPASGT
jgi:hypothetical protein